LTIAANGKNQDIPVTGTGITAISGKVTDLSTGTSLAFATVTLSSSAAAQTDVNGNYSFSSLPANGTYNITFSKTGYVSTDRAYRTGKNYSIDGGTDTFNTAFAGTAYSTFTGKVTDLSTGRPLAAATVALLPVLPPRLTPAAFTAFRPCPPTASTPLPSVKAATAVPRLPESTIPPPPTPSWTWA